MPRPEKFRWVSHPPGVSFFKPHGVPLRTLEQVCLGMDELEALRLADLENLNQEDAARQMNVSRATFGRIVARARQKTSDALVHGKSILIQGGHVRMRPVPPEYPPGRGRHRHGRGWRG
jgi:predicted DNA-binding protein (UPF0251 family)